MCITRSAEVGHECRNGGTLLRKASNLAAGQKSHLLSVHPFALSVASDRY